MAAIATPHLQPEKSAGDVELEWNGRPSASWQTLARARPKPASTTAPVVFMVHEDVALLESVERLIGAIGWEVMTFHSAFDFLSHASVAVPSCVLLDVATSEIDGFELQRRLAVERPDISVIFVSEARDVATAVRAMKSGAVDFLTTPFRDDVLVRAIAGALEGSRSAFDARQHGDELRDRYATLSPREREVMALVVAGRLNKLVGDELGISEITVKAHRGQAMRKMQAESLPDLVTMATRLGLAVPAIGRSARAAGATAAGAYALPWKNATASRP